MKTNLKPKEDFLAERARRYTETPFSVDRGPRRDLIISDLHYNMKLNPFTDSYGNVWCRKGKGEPAVVISSHMDTVFELNPYKYHAKTKENKHGTKIIGTLDNSMGCVINAETIEKVEPKCETWFVFTVGEEPTGRSYGYVDEDIGGFAYGAKSVCDTLRAMKIKPGLCIALDVTYPAELKHHRFLRFKNKEEDLTCAYAENFSSKGLVKLFKKFIFENGLYPSVKARDLSTPDEASLYGLKYPALAFGPPVHGNMHGISSTYLENLTAATKFLEKVLTQPEFIKNVAEEDKRDRHNSYAKQKQPDMPNLGSYFGEAY